MRVEEVQKFQHPDPEKSLIDTYKAIYYEHAPLYFLIARVWMQLFDTDLLTSRSLSAFFSLLVFPCLYWLCLELFKSSLVGLIAMALFAISPLHVLYAQEARQYSLWTVIILLSNWAILRAIRTNNKIHWGIYALTLAGGLYTHILSVIVVIGHSIYLIISERCRASKIVFSYLLASAIGFLFFIPWIIVIFAEKGGSIQAPDWSKAYTPLTSLVQTWILNLSRIFFDIDRSFSYKDLWLYLLILCLVFYSIYFILTNSEKRIWLFILIPAIAPVVLLMVPDLLLEGRRSTPIRYFIPCYLNIQIIVAYLLANQITSSYINPWRQKLWQIVTVVLISSGVLSGIAISQADTWWTKYREYYHSEVAKIVNIANHPLVIVPWYDMRTLSHSLVSNVVLQDIRLLKNINSVGKDFSDIFVYQDRDSLDYFLKNHPNYQIEKSYTWKRQTTPVNTTYTILWKLNKTPIKSG
jgi:uncharacterized membrane protein